MIIYATAAEYLLALGQVIAKVIGSYLNKSHMVDKTEQRYLDSDRVFDTVKLKILTVFV